MRKGSRRRWFALPRLLMSLTPAPSDAGWACTICWIFLVVMAFSSGVGRQQAFDPAPGLRQCGVAAGFAHRQPFSIDELHVRDAEEGEEVAHVRGLRVAGRALVEAAARGEDVGLLAGQQPDRTFLRVAEGDADARDVVE